MRYNALSRAIETALQREGIPSRVLAGQKFFDRVEVKINGQNSDGMLTEYIGEGSTGLSSINRQFQL